MRLKLKMHMQLCEYASTKQPRHVIKIIEFEFEKEFEACDKRMNLQNKNNTHSRCWFLDKSSPIF